MKRLHCSGTTFFNFPSGKMVSMLLMMREDNYILVKSHQKRIYQRENGVASRGRD